jgi:hypothetical protein
MRAAVTESKEEGQSDCRANTDREDTSNGDDQADPRSGHGLLSPELESFYFFSIAFLYVCRGVAGRDAMEPASIALQQLVTITMWPSVASVGSDGTWRSLALLVTVRHTRRAHAFEPSRRTRPRFVTRRVMR